MLGAIAGSGLFPFPREAYEAVVRGGDTSAPEKVSKMAAASLRGFAKAFDVVRSAARKQAAMVTSLLASSSDEAPRAAGAAADGGGAFPAAGARHARARPCARARLPGRRLTPTSTCERLQRVLAAERAADPAGAHGFAITREMARWLALWMAFDDIVRVAELKSRASRAAPRARRSQGGRRRHRQGLRPLQAGRARVRGPAAGVAGRPRDRMGPRARRGKRPGRCRSRSAAIRSSAWPRCALLAVAALAARARQPLRARTGADRALARRGGRRHAHATGAWATRSRCAAASSRATAAPTSAARTTCCT